jgi:phosphoenolpyruvate synthase/pyruvate phosphate dikinase
MGYTKEELHELLKYKFLKYAKEIAGQPVVIVPSTSDFRLQENLPTYIENVLQICYIEYGCFSFQDGMPQIALKSLHD